jgi:DNA-binding NarL/FixJ family response regulator
MGDRKLRVMVADDHEQARWAIAYLLQPECDVIGAVADGTQLVGAALSLRPDVIVSDVSMPSLSGPQAMDQLKRRGSNIPFVFVSVDPSGKKEVLELGAGAFVAKIDMGRELIAAVFTVASGSRNRGDQFAADLVAQDVASLSGSCDASVA